MKTDEAQNIQKTRKKGTARSPVSSTGSLDKHFGSVFPVGCRYFPLVVGISLAGKTLGLLRSKIPIQYGKDLRSFALLGSVFPVGCRYFPKVFCEAKYRSNTGKTLGLLRSKIPIQYGKDLSKIPIQYGKNLRGFGISLRSFAKQNTDPIRETPVINTDVFTGG